MSETPPRYRTRDRPGPGLATIAEPDGREVLWVLNRGERHRATCAVPRGRGALLLPREHLPPEPGRGALVPPLRRGRGGTTRRDTGP